MHFREDALEDFLLLFAQHRASIRSQHGCRSIQLVRSTTSPLSISTVSHWESEADLDNYRNSALFGVVWPSTKALFAEPPTASSHSVEWAS